MFLNQNMAGPNRLFKHQQSTTGAFPKTERKSDQYQINYGPCKQSTG